MKCENDCRQTSFEFWISGSVNSNNSKLQHSPCTHSSVHSGPKSRRYSCAKITNSIAFPKKRYYNTYAIWHSENIYAITSREKRFSVSYWLTFQCFHLTSERVALVNIHLLLLCLIVYLLLLLSSVLFRLNTVHTFVKCLVYQHVYHFAIANVNRQLQIHSMRMTL